MLEELSKALNKFSVSITTVKSRLIEIGKEKYTNTFDSTKMPPIHYNHCYFTMASLILDNVKNVLEIGTGPGRSTVVFAKLFPEATIYTVDVPPDDPTFPKSWQGRGVEAEFVGNVNLKNIKFGASNSFFLPSIGLPKQFELIFVDGDHTYPVVAWDIMFSYNWLAKGGFLFMHDYEVETKTPNDVRQAIEYMERRIKEKVFLLPEYADPKWANGKMACLIKE